MGPSAHGRKGDRNEHRRRAAGRRPPPGGRHARVRRGRGQPEPLRGRDPTHRGTRVDPRPERGGGRLRGRGGGAADRPARGLRRQLRTGEHAPDPGTVRRAPERRAGARHRLAHPVRADRYRRSSRRPTPSGCSSSAATTASWSSQASQMPRLARIAIQHAVGRGGVAVLVMPGDVLHRARGASDRRERARDRARDPRAARPTRCARWPTASTPPRTVTLVLRRGRPGRPRRGDGARRQAGAARSGTRCGARNGSSTTTPTTSA